MESPPVNGMANGRMVEPMPAMEPQQGFDILKVLWRWKWLPILGAFVGTGLGYLYFSKQPAEYQASALVRVVDSLPPSTRLQQRDPNDTSEITRSDESLVIQSQKVLRMAVERGQLTEQPAFSSLGLSAEQITADLMVSEDLVIQPAAKDDNTTLLEINYICTDADLAAVVVNAIVDGYSDYLTEEYRTVGNEMYELVTKAQDRLSQTYKDLSKKDEEFRARASNVIWTGDEVSDPYAMSYASVQAELSELRVERKKLRGTLEHVQSAIDAGRPPEHILVMLSSDNENSVVDSMFGNPDAPRIRQTPLESRSNSESARLERTELFALQMREQELLDTVGNGHPSVANARKKIQLMQEHIARIAESEKQEELELERLREEEAQAALAEQLAPSGIPVEQRLEIHVQALTEKYASLDIQEKELQALAEQDLAKSKELQQFLGENRLLNSELSSVKTLLDAYTEKLNEVELLPQGGQRTLKELNLPSIGAFYGPKLPPYLLGGAAVGFLVMSGLAVLMDLADRSYRSPDEIAADLGIPVLGHIPIMEIQNVKKVVEAIDPSLSTIHHSRGRVSEAFRAVRTGLFFSNRCSELKVIQVTSPVPGDGKSTLSANLAVTMAQSGRRVLLIDADFRRPRIAKLFGIDATVGMAAVVAGSAELEDATYSSHVANLSIMPGGKRPSNPAELLSSNRFSDLMDVLREKYDIIIVDTPPMLAVSDPSAVAAVVDGVVLTMRLRRNVKPLATRATKILETVDARFLGVVVNGVSAEAGYGYSYGYNDYRYAYRYGGNYRDGYKYGYGGKYGGYGSYTAGYIEEKQ